MACCLKPPVASVSPQPPWLNFLNHNLSSSPRFTQYPKLNGGSPT
ncbi:hypothetical protein A2U01_0096694, partial [Trifolium medium]|nr:hypothetical protein [Trifolium medium]